MNNEIWVLNVGLIILVSLTVELVVTNILAFNLSCHWLLDE